jgi:hypothetical protein
MQISDEMENKIRTRRFVILAAAAIVTVTWRLTAWLYGIKTGLTATAGRGSSAATPCPGNVVQHPLAEPAPGLATLGGTGQLKHRRREERPLESAHGERQVVAETRPHPGLVRLDRMAGRRTSLTHPNSPNRANSPENDLHVLCSRPSASRNCLK